MRIELAGLSEIICMLVASLGACMATAGESSQHADTSITSPEVIDEVVVNGARLRELRAAVLKAEDLLIARYNVLNHDTDFDIECLPFTPTGTHLSYRYCLTKLQKRAQQQDASEILTFMHNIDVENGQTAPIALVSARLMERSEDYRDNLTRLLQEHPDLRELVHQRADALRRYDEAEARKRSKGKAPQ